MMLLEWICHEDSTQICLLTVYSPTTDVPHLLLLLVSGFC